MVLKSDDHDDASEASYTLLASELRKGQKGLRKRKDRLSINRRSNAIKEVLHSDTDKDNKSLKSGQVNSLGKGVEVAESKTSPGNFGLDYEMEDGQHESKHSQISEGTTQKLLESDGTVEPSLQTSHGDDVDESDVEEEDVKVCDICGDAGREDLLAVCSKCSDGAEHTYCMREMLDKVPEGDWLCEECKYNEALEVRKQEHLKLLGTERSKSLGRTSSAINSDVISKLDSKDSFTERSKPKTVSLSKQLSLKRSGDSIETGQTTKKQVVESSTGSPTVLSPNRVPVLSKDYSLKNLEKSKGKPTNQYSTGNESGGDSSENTRSPTKGSLLKSNSFSSSKANVKLSEEVVQKQKLVVDVKDVPGKLIGKSMSFKGPGRSSIGEPKVKMLSPKCTPVQDLKGQKQIRERNSFERKNSIKLDNSFPVQISANSTKRVSRGDNISSLPVSNSRDYKNATFDGKSTSLGEVKRLSSTNIRGSGTISSNEVKPTHASSKDSTTFNSYRSLDGSYGGANGTKGEVHDIQNEKALENTFGRSKQGANGGYRRGFSSDGPTLRAKDGVHEENKLKAALEAAMQKKQDIVKKNKMPEKLSELSMANSQGNHVGDLFSNQGSDLISEEVHLVSNHTSNSSKNVSVGSLKQLKAEGIISSFEEDQFTLSAIPEHEAFWQGGFEIHRNGKLPDFCGGFQAHLSSLASDKVLEVVRKFPQKIVFNEVSRHCVWPFPIKEDRAREDNIALYFFAKDLESYMRSYKILLEYMMKHDLALKGNINGFELLIFPSNHLAQRSQRWNTLFFLWGVFRGRRARCSDDRFPPLERPEIDVSVSTTVPRVKDIPSLASLSKNTSLQRLEVENSSLSGIDIMVSRCETPVLGGSSQKKSGTFVNGDCHDEGRDVGGTCLTSPTSQVNLEERCEKYSSVVSAERRSESGTYVVQDQRARDPKVVQHHHSSKDGGNHNNLHGSSKSMSINPSDKQDISDSPKLHMVVKKEDCSIFVDEKSDNSLKKEDQCVDNIKNIGGQVILDKKMEQVEDNKDSMRKNDVIELKSESRLKQEGYVDINVPPECSLEDLQSSPTRHSDEDLVKLPSKPISMTSQTGPWMDQRDTLDGDFYGHRVPSSFGDGFDTQMHDVSTSSRIHDNSQYDKFKSLKPGSTERCFFLMDSSNVGQTVQLADCSSPWKVSLLETENRLLHPSPDLELALGVEKKQSGKGVVLPFLGGIVDEKGPDRPPDIASPPKEEDEDGSASLSLSLAFPFSDTDSPARLKGL